MREYLVVFGVAVAVTYMAATAVRLIALRFGVMAKVRDRDVHDKPTPYLGGVAMLAGLIAAYLVALQLPFLSRSDEIFSDVLGVMAGGAIIAIVGVLDDIYELDALSKFAGQVFAAIIAIAMGVQYFYVPWPGNYVGLDQTQAIIFTIFMIVLTANAVNFVDGLDGLSSGIVGIGAVAFFIFAFVLAMQNGENRAVGAALLTAALAGVCVGMLPHNFFPARMFIGDSGSMLIGFVLAGSAISLSGRFPVTGDEVTGSGAGILPALLPLILPFTILIVPFIDLTLAVIRRTRAGVSPFSADKLHIHHRLLEIGHSHRRAVLLMYAMAALVAFGSVILVLWSGPISLVAFVLLAFLTLTVMFWAPRYGLKDHS